MAFNIFERWPWTSYQNLNLDWILRNMKEAVEKATKASENVGSFDDRITQNSKDIAQLLLDVESIARPLRIFVNSNLEVLHAAYPMTGGAIYDLIAGKEYLPFIEYLNEYYMLADIQTNSLVFQKLHIPTIGNPYIKILTIPLTESRAGYTIKEWTGGGGGGGSDDIRIVKITATNGGYTSDTAYAQIIAAMNAGQHIAMQLLSGGNVLWETATVFLYGNNNQYIAFTNPRSFMDGSGQMYGIIIDSSNNVKNLIGSNYITADSFLTNYLPRLLPVVSASDNGKVLGVVNGEWAVKTDDGGSGSGLTEEAKQALLNCFENVAWINDDGRTFYDALYAALYPPADVLSISAVFTQGSTVIHDTDDLDTLKQYLVVTATMNDSTTQTVTAYTLSGTLTEGTSTITVSYGGKTTTFTVNVTGVGWSSGVPYSDLTIIPNEFCSSGSGKITPYNGWDRTDYVPCAGAARIVFSALPQDDGREATSNWFFDENKQPFYHMPALNKTESTTVTVPTGAAYFIISCTRAALASCVSGGITPYAD